MLRYGARLVASVLKPVASRPSQVLPEEDPTLGLLFQMQAAVRLVRMMPYHLDFVYKRFSTPSDPPGLWRHVGALRAPSLRVGYAIVAKGTAPCVVCPMPCAASRWVHDLE